MLDNQQLSIFVVSMQADTDRRAFITEQLNHLGLKFSFFDAVDCRQGIPDQYQYRCDHTLAYQRMGRKMLNGEWGAALSHALVYEKIVAEQIQHAIILEDDVVLSDDFKQLVTTDELQRTQAGLILLYAAMTWYTPRWLRPQRIADYRLYRPTHRICSCITYYLDLPMATRLKQATQTISHVADWPIDTRFHARLLVPFVVSHSRQFESNIENGGERTELIRAYYEGNSLFSIIKRLKIYKWLRSKLFIKITQD